MRKVVLVVASAAVLAGGSAWWFRQPLMARLHSLTGGFQIGIGERPMPDARTYEVLVSELERWRQLLAERHRLAANDDQRADVVADARILLERVLPEMMHCWLGTPWDFHGTAEKPGQGRIACGYFVATVLRDAGFRVDRFRLAQQPSGNIIRSFLQKEACSLDVGKPYETFAAEAAARPNGIYLVGLDTHVAFLVVTNGAFRFIHSSGSRPWCVVDESPAEAQVLRQSNWRMLGNLTGDPQVVLRWLRAQAISVKQL